MNKIRYDQSSSTFSYGLFTAGLLTMLSIQVPYADIPANYGSKGLFQNSYAAGGHKPTFNTFGSLVVGLSDLTTSSVERVVSNFYVNLLASQEPLGAEFEKVLHENLWDLYES